MAMFKPSATTTNGVYQWLLQREEQDHYNWQTTHGQATNAVYLRQAGLGALRAGDPVTVLVCDLPGWARPAGTPQQVTTRAEAQARGRNYQRKFAAAVTVYADDRIVRGVEGTFLVTDYRLL